MPPKKGLSAGARSHRRTKSRRKTTSKKSKSGTKKHARRNSMPKNNKSTGSTTNTGLRMLSRQEIKRSRVTMSMQLTIIQNIADSLGIPYEGLPKETLVRKVNEKLAKTT